MTMSRMAWTLLLFLPFVAVRSHSQSLPGSGGVGTSANVEAATCSSPGSPDAEPTGFEPVSGLSFAPDRAPSARGAESAGARGPPHAPTVDFEPLGGWKASTAEPGFRVTLDHSAPGSAPFVAEARYPIGFGDGRSPVWVERDVAGLEHSRLYLCFWVKLSDNWQGHGSGVNKIGFVWTDGSPVVALAAVGADDGPLVPQIRLQDMPSESARNLEPGLDDATIRRGVWHRWEVVLVMNGWTEANGEAHWWIDGRKVGESRDIRYVDPAAEGIWEKVAWRPTWGGRGDAVRETMYMWLDHLYVSGAP